MKLLLDTHIWLWSLLAPDSLTRRVLRELEKPDNELWLSPLSVWELLVLSEKKKVVLDEPPETWAARATAAPLREAPLTHEVALATAKLRLAHRDPVDRFLVATTKVFDLTLVTADHRLIGAGGFPVLANE